MYFSKAVYRIFNKNKHLNIGSYSFSRNNRDEVDVFKVTPLFPAFLL